MQSAVPPDLLLDLQQRVVGALGIADAHELTDIGIALDQSLQHIAHLLGRAGLADRVIAVEAPAGPDCALRFMPAR